jgi:GNAT superfamily N-acetyltransferase
VEVVRDAVPADAGRLDELARDLIASVTGQRGGAELVGPGEPTPLGILGARTFDELLTDPDRRILVGTLDGVATGVAACRLAVRADGSRTGVLDACYVEPGARGMGLGHLLAEEALRWFRDTGCVGVDGVALPGDRVAKQFFESVGFKARMLTMHRPLG